jgi:DNA-binding transcriptional LysR family regulator
MRLRQIEVFHAVYSCGSVTRAAEVLNVSQPSVSKVLAHAEQQLGYMLFDRVRGKLVPTPEADRLFSHVTTVYESVDRLRHVAENLKSAESGKIRIAATPAFGIDLLPKAISSFRIEHDDVVFVVETLHHDEICNALLESRLDVGLAFDPVAVPGVAETVLANGTFVVLTPPDVSFGDTQSVSVADLAELPFIKLDSKGPLGRLLSTHIESSGAELDTVAFCETYHVAKSLVSYGSGVTITDNITANAKGHNNIRLWPFEPTLNFRISALNYDGVPLSRVAQKFVEHLDLCIGDYLGQRKDT